MNRSQTKSKRGRPLTNPTINTKELLKIYKSGNLLGCAKHFHTSTGRCRDLLRGIGVELRPIGRPTGSFNKDRLSEVLAHRNQGLSNRQIAKIYGVTHQAISAFVIYHQTKKP